jgi:hypothetical protein
VSYASLVPYIPSVGNTVSVICDWWRVSVRDCDWWEFSAMMGFFVTNCSIGEAVNSDQSKSAVKQVILLLDLQKLALLLHFIFHETVIDLLTALLLTIFLK